MSVFPLSGKALDFRTKLREGYGVAEAARQVRMDYPTAYQIAKALGWKKSDKTLPDARPDSLREISNKDIVRRVQEGETLDTVAKDAGVSRQRISQICQTENIDIRELRKVRQEQKTAEHKQERERAREAVAAERFKEAKRLDKLWQKKLTVPEIAAHPEAKHRFKDENSLSVYIARWRKRGLFKKRKG